MQRGHGRASYVVRTRISLQRLVHRRRFGRRRHGRLRASERSQRLCLRPSAALVSPRVRRGSVACERAEAPQCCAQRAAPSAQPQAHCSTSSGCAGS
eukprot:655996-Prymnesium_polylepis.1